MNQNNNKSDLKKFFIKLTAITFSVIIIINITYNLIFADKIENINKLLPFKKESVDLIKDKIRLEVKNGLLKEQILNDEDKILFSEFYLKLKNEFEEIEKQ